MGAFDKVTKTIRCDDWDDGEEVVITELLYVDSVVLQTSAMAELSIGDMSDEDTRKAVKMGTLDLGLPVLGLLQKCIVSWTLTKDGKVLPVTLANIKLLPARYGDYIAEQIEEMNPTRDEEFPAETGVDGKEGQSPA